MEQIIVLPKPSDLSPLRAAPSMFIQRQEVIEAINKQLTASDQAPLTPTRTKTIRLVPTPIQSDKNMTKFIQRVRSSTVRISVSLPTTNSRDKKNRIEESNSGIPDLVEARFRALEEAGIARERASVMREEASVARDQLSGARIEALEATNEMSQATNEMSQARIKALEQYKYSNNRKQLRLAIPNFRNDAIDSILKALASIAKPGSSKAQHRRETSNTSETSLDINKRDRLANGLDAKKLRDVGLTAKNLVFLKDYKVCDVVLRWFHMTY